MIRINKIPTISSKRAFLEEILDCFQLEERKEKSIWETTFFKSILGSKSFVNTIYERTQSLYRTWINHTLCNILIHLLYASIDTHHKLRTRLRSLFLWRRRYILLESYWNNRKGKLHFYSHQKGRGISIIILNKSSCEIRLIISILCISIEDKEFPGGMDLQSF